jgi:hypothetical protein
MKLKNPIFCLIILFFLLMSLGFSKSKIMYRAVFTTDLANDAPISDIDSIPISTEKILLFTNWYNLNIDKQYEYTVAIYDGKNNILSLSPIILEPTESSLHTLTTYKINQKIDKPGKWKFEIYLNNKLMFKKFLKITKDK